MMQAAILLLLAGCCPLALVGAESPMTGNENAVFSAEEAMQHQFVRTAGRNISATRPMAAMTVERAASKVATPPASAQPEAKKSKLHAEVKRRQAAEIEASRLRGVLAKEGVLLSAAESEIRGKLGQKALDDLHLDSEKQLAGAVEEALNVEAKRLAGSAVRSQLVNMTSELAASQAQAAVSTKKFQDAAKEIALLKVKIKAAHKRVAERASEKIMTSSNDVLATEVELAKEQDDSREEKQDQQSGPDASSASVQAKMKAEVESAHLELRAAKGELNSSRVVLAVQVRALNTTLASLRHAESQREAAEKTTSEEARALARAKATLAGETAALTSMNATLSKTSAELGVARAQLGAEAAASDSAAKLRRELQGSHAESEALKQKLGRVVHMVEEDLTAKDKQAADAIAAERRVSKKLQSRLAAKELELGEARGRRAGLGANSRKLRGSAMFSPGEGLRL